MFRKSKSTPQRVNQANESVHVSVLGEADSGKSAFLAKAFDPATVITPLDRSNYWSSQQSPANPLHEKDGVPIRFGEVMGSRGRMSNYYEVRMGMASADLVVVCVAATNWQGALTFEAIVEHAEHELRRVQSLAKETKAVAPPVFVVITMTDLAPDLKVPDNYVKNGVRYVATSAMNNTGVREAFDAIVEAALTTDTARRLRAKNAPPAAETEPGKLPSPSPSSNKMLAKLFKLFGVASEAPAAAAPPAPPAPAVVPPASAEEPALAVSA